MMNKDLEAVLEKLPQREKKWYFKSQSGDISQEGPSISNLLITDSDEEIVHRFCTQIRPLLEKMDLIHEAVGSVST